ncbi:MAG: hypothetical protein VYC67_05500 [Pseudomonadota bacterium]|nr:hypothetical protein [Pseudomonadota bacterium]
MSSPSIESSKNSEERLKEPVDIPAEEAEAEIFEELIRVERVLVEKKSKDSKYDLTKNSGGMSRNDLYTAAMMGRVEESLLETSKLQAKRSYDDLDIRDSYKDWLTNQLMEILEEYDPIIRLNIKVVDVELVEIEKQKEFKGVLNTTEPCLQCNDGRFKYDHQLSVFIDGERILVTIN